jgi:hypothetical protein
MNKQKAAEWLTDKIITLWEKLIEIVKGGNQ